MTLHEIEICSYLAPALQRLWEGKFQVPTCAREASTKLTAYTLSLEDAQRTHISEEELCSFLWGFHFKPVAGEHWMLLDPYCEEGCIRQSAGSLPMLPSAWPKVLRCRLSLCNGGLAG